MNEPNSPSATFCILPWIHLATWTSGEATLCCLSERDSGENLNRNSPKEIWNSAYWKKTRLDMLAGKKVKACTRCYDEEKLGYKSHRLSENGYWDSERREELQKRVAATRADGSLDEGLVTIDLRLGNQCNLQCVMCQPSESTKWTRSAKELSSALRDPLLAYEWRGRSQLNQKDYQWHRRAVFWDDLRESLPYIRRLIIGGGEPMLIREHVRFIRECAESGHAGKILLRYHTNGTVRCDELLPYWEKFQRVELCVSIDGTEETNAYVRYGADWPALRENIHFYDRLPMNVTMHFHAAVHALNIYGIPDLVRWLRDQNLVKVNNPGGIADHFHANIVQYPDYLDVRLLPPAAKRAVRRRIETLQAELKARVAELDAIVRFMESADLSRRLPKLREYCRALDSVRGTRTQKTFPEASFLKPSVWDLPPLRWLPKSIREGETLPSSPEPW